jgi:GrpB-like predicted nucleotidyltransferase (UPF0157 family)
MNFIKKALSLPLATFLGVIFGRKQAMILPFASSLAATFAYYGTFNNKMVWLIPLGVTLVKRIYDRRNFISTFVWLNTHQEDLILEKFSSDWKVQVVKENVRFESILKKYDHLIEKSLTDGIQHVGSTSIVDIALAKPAHDIVLTLNTDSVPDELISDIESLGYTCIGSSPHDPDFDHWFMRHVPDDLISEQGVGFGLHVFSPGGHESAKKMMVFRDYVNQNESERQLYGDTKQKIKSENVTSVLSYSMKKSTVVGEIMTRAVAWGTKNKLYKLE